MNTHTAFIDLKYSANLVFKTLITPSDVCRWWGASRAIIIPLEAGIWTASWGNEDLPDFINAYVITKFNKPRSLYLSQFRYFDRNKPTPDFTFDMETHFDITDTPNGCRLTVTQSGFPDTAEAIEFLKGCEVGWKQTLSQIGQFLDTKLQ